MSPNVAAHADAGSCDVRVNHDGQQLIFEVEDDGRGIPDHHRLGMGRESMRERAEELGGNLTVTPNTSGSGTMVGAVLPCARSATPPRDSGQRIKHDGPRRAIDTRERPESAMTTPSSASA